MTPFKVSDLSNLSAINYNQDQITRDYQILHDLFSTQEVQSQMVYDKIYHDRNRYSDIITYQKTRVKLTPGPLPASEYINACYVNSPMPLDNPSDPKVLGNKKIIAS